MKPLQNKANFIKKVRQFDKRLAHDKSPIIHNKREFIIWLRKNN